MNVIYMWSLYELNIKNILRYAKDRFCRRVSSVSLSSDTPRYFLHEFSESAGWFSHLKKRMMNNILKNPKEKYLLLFPTPRSFFSSSKMEHFCASFSCKLKKTSLEKSIMVLLLEHLTFFEENTLSFSIRDILT